MSSLESIATSQGTAVQLEPVSLAGKRSRSDVPDEEEGGTRVDPGKRTRKETGAKEKDDDAVYDSDLEISNLDTSSAGVVSMDEVPDLATQKDHIDRARSVDKSSEKDQDAASSENAGENESKEEDEDGLTETMRWKMVFPNAEELKFAVSTLSQLYTDVFARMIFDKSANRACLCIAQLNPSRTALNVHTVPCTVYVAPDVNVCPMFRVPLQSLLYAIDSAKNDTSVHLFVENDPRYNITTDQLIVVVPTADAREQDTTVIKMLEWDGAAPSVSPMKPDFSVTMPVSRLLNALRVEKSRIKFTVLNRRGENRLVFRIETGNDQSVKRKEVMHDSAKDLDSSGAVCGTRTVETDPLTMNRFRSEAKAMDVVFEAEYPGSIISKFLSSPHLRPQSQIVIHLFSKEPLLLEANCGSANAKLLVPPLITQDSE